MNHTQIHNVGRAMAVICPDLLGWQTGLSGASSSLLNCHRYPPFSCRSGDNRCVSCSCCQEWQVWDRGQGASMAAFPDLEGKGNDGLSDMDLFEGTYGYVDPGPGISLSSCFHMERVYSSSDFRREILPLVCAEHLDVHADPFGAGLSKDSFSFSCIVSPLRDHTLLRRSHVH